MIINLTEVETVSKELAVEDSDMSQVIHIKKTRVAILDQQGLSSAKISKQIRVSRCAVQALWKKFKETSLEDHRHSAQPRKLSSR